MDPRKADTTASNLTGLRIPAKELIDGVMILFAGALLLTPGFLTDVVGVLLLLPPVRAGLRAGTTNALRRRVGRGGIGTGRVR